MRRPTRKVSNLSRTLNHLAEIVEKQESVSTIESLDREELGDRRSLDSRSEAVNSIDEAEKIIE
jgi:hypothetical protein